MARVMASSDIMGSVMFHRITLTAAAALLAAGPALAGGFATPVATPIVTPPVVPVAPQIVTNDWSGPYAGAQLGFGRASVNEDATTPNGDFQTDDIYEGEGALFGVHAGYMFDFGRFVAGAEIDWDRTQIDLITNEEFYGVEEEVGQIDSIARAKLRLGFDAGRVLPYVTAGVAGASFDIDEDFIDSYGEEDSFGGRFFGIGASFMASERLMVSVEGLRHTFEELPQTAIADDGSEFANETIVDTLTLRGSFRF
jgi:opacity protein-like surface antigen